MHKTNNKFSHITTVLFDLDDTLLNSLPARAKALQYVFNTSGITQFDAAVEVQRLRGYEIKDILLKCGANRENLDNLFNEYRRAYWTEEHGKLELFPGINPLLQKLHVNFKLGIVSQKGRDFLFEGHRAGTFVELEKIGISKLFPVVVGLEDVTKLKPDPEGIKLAMKKLNSSPKETLYVGDSHADMTAAKAAGCLSCYARWGLPLEAAELEADFTAHTPEELMKFIFP